VVALNVRLPWGSLYRRASDFRRSARLALADRLAGGDLGERGALGRLPIRPDQAGYAVETSCGEFCHQKTRRIDGAWHFHSSFRNPLESRFGIDRLVSDQHDQLVTAVFRLLERTLDQCCADAMRTEWRLDGKRPQQRRRRFGERS